MISLLAKYSVLVITFLTWVDLSFASINFSLHLTKNPTFSEKDKERYQLLAHQALQELANQITQSNQFNNQTIKMAKKIVLNFSREEECFSISFEALACAGKNNPTIFFTRKYYEELKHIEENFAPVLKVVKPNMYVDFVKVILLHEFLHVLGFDHVDNKTSIEMNEVFQKFLMTLEIENPIGPIKFPKTRESYLSYYVAQFPLIVKEWELFLSNNTSKMEHLKHILRDNEYDKVSFITCRLYSSVYATYYLSLGVITRDGNFYMTYNTQSGYLESEDGIYSSRNVIEKLLNEDRYMKIESDRMHFEIPSSSVEFEISSIDENKNRKIVLKVAPGPETFVGICD